MGKRGRSPSTEPDSDATGRSSASISSSRHACWLAERRHCILQELRKEQLLQEQEETQVLAVEAQEAEVAFLEEFERQAENQREIQIQEHRKLSQKDTSQGRTAVHGQRTS
jgi:hypothetical protein